MLEETQKKKCSVELLRHSEYYNTQAIYDELYKRSAEGEVFATLMPIIVDEKNIMLAYRNIKANTGSHTRGTDSATIEDIGKLTTAEVVEEVRQRLRGKNGYHPGIVRRKEIPKAGDLTKTRPLGIPCIWDRLIQQCIKQVLEPICEAKFYEHSYGFRPNRSVEHAIASTVKHMQLEKLHYVVEFDIKGFFDNVNHSKLIKQIWTLGIRDKELIYILKQILKAPIRLENGEIVYPDKGTPQGGIISPLLANIVLNELDWWIASQWEFNPVINKYKVQINKNGTPNKGNAYHEMRKTGLKEMYIVRYADDFRIFCRNRETAEKAMIATTRWLKKRLKLDISPEKTRIVNTRKHSTKFLGFCLRVRKQGSPAKTQKQAEQYKMRSWEEAVATWKKTHPNGQQKQCAEELGTNTTTVNKWWHRIEQPQEENKRVTKYVIESHVSKENVDKIKANLKKQLRRIKYPKNSTEQYEIEKYNSQVLGYHNYFEIATMVAQDFKPIRDTMVLSWHNAMKTPRGARITRNGTLSGPAMRFKGYKDVRFSKETGKVIYPIGAVKYRTPKCRNRKVNSFTESGRAMIHKELAVNKSIMNAMAKNPIWDKSMEYNDNRISLYSAQNGKCAVTGKPFETANDIHCHHKIPKEKGGNDKYQNLILVSKPVHILIHAKSKEVILKYLAILQLDKKAMRKLNELRKTAGNAEIEFTKL